MLKKAHVLFFLILAFSALCTNLVFAEDEDLGFYAGPLSIVTETVAEVTAKKINSNDKNSELRKAQEETSKKAES